MSRPALSVIVVFHDMAREAPRTLHTLSAAHQRGVGPEDYEVIAVDAGSAIPLTAATVASFGGNVSLLRADRAPSPAAAINAAVRRARGDAVMVCIDGARMFTPGVVRLAIDAFAAWRDPVVATLAWHLGPKLQNESMLEGYDQSVEDRLLDSVDWRRDGYELFRIAVFAWSSRRGWFLPLEESNGVAVRRDTFARLGGFDERFRTPGGGFVNLDFFLRSCTAARPVVHLLGEGTFHQFHGGVATNVPLERHPFPTFHEEYLALRGVPFAPAESSPLVLGSVPPQAIPFLERSVAEARAAVSCGPAAMTVDTAAGPGIVRAGGIESPTGDRPPRVLFLSSAPSSAGHVYRVEHAAEGLAARGWETRILALDDRRAAEEIGRADIVTVFRGVWGPAYEAVHAAASARAIPLVEDIDDLLFDDGVMRSGAVALLDHLSADAREAWLLAADGHRRALAVADAAVVTTPALAAAAAAVVPRVHLVPNGVDARMIAAAGAARSAPRPGDVDGLVRLGFASGTPTHHRDLASIAGPLAEVLGRRADLRLVIVGHLDLDHVPQLAPFASRIERRPAVPLDELAWELARFDINLAPLESGNRFCECKSPIRVTAASLVGVPSIVAPVGVLPEAVCDGRTGIVATDGPAWRGAIEALASDPGRRRALGEASRLDVIDRFGPDAIATNLVRAYASILSVGRR